MPSDNEDTSVSSPDPKRQRQQETNIRFRQGKHVGLYRTFFYDPRVEAERAIFEEVGMEIKFKPPDLICRGCYQKWKEMETLRETAAGETASTTKPFKLDGISSRVVTAKNHVKMCPYTSPELKAQLEMIDSIEAPSGVKATMLKSLVPGDGRALHPNLVVSPSKAHKILFTKMRGRLIGS